MTEQKNYCDKQLYSEYFDKKFDKITDDIIVGKFSLSLLSNDEIDRDFIEFKSNVPMFFQ